ncbi:MAG: SDR family oxidoreductase [Planctomycetaceae bacterium]|nr:SDR family oxidoreductase [Planctomycetaceae bacterium]
MSHLLLTGATGLLGRYMMRDLLTKGASLAVLVRKSRKYAPWERIEAAMRTWERELGRSLPRPVVLSGDISAGDFTLPKDELTWARENCTGLIHNAASLSFVTTGRHAEPYRTNVDGTRYVLEFCRDANIRQFFHVSTAYVCGMRSGKVLESELNVGQEFANCYEESKVESEEMVRNSPDLDLVTVFRPAIIIGDSQSGVTFTYHNFYVMLQIAYTLVNGMGSPNFTSKTSAQMVQFNVDGSERKNLVPVDWVSEAMTRIMVDPQLHGETYHLTPRLPVNMRLVRDVFEEAVGFYGAGFYGQGKRRENGHEAEDLFHQHMEVYQSYWRDDPEFDCSNTRRALPDLPCPHVDRSMLLRLSKVAIANRFSWKDAVVKK